MLNYNLLQCSVSGTTWMRYIVFLLQASRPGEEDTHFSQTLPHLEYEPCSSVEKLNDRTERIYFTTHLYYRYALRNDFIYDDAHCHIVLACLRYFT